MGIERYPSVTGEDLALRHLRCVQWLRRSHPQNAYFACRKSRVCGQMQREAGDTKMAGKYEKNDRIYLRLERNLSV